MNPQRLPSPCGVLLVDKPPGCTSHDVVAWARRAFHTREVGHAGTLDPAATGVLVLLVGEATKLSSFITAEDKSYEAAVRFGVETDSLDADGAVTRTGPEHVATDALRDTLLAMIGPMQQVPPAVSAIKVGGVASHERVRRGEPVSLPPREVTLCAATLLAHVGAQATVAISASKGFYVRALARDLAARLGTVAHLSALRRTRSGCFSVDECLAGETLRDARSDELARGAARDALRSVESLEGRVPSVRIGVDAVRDLRCGRATAAPEGTPDGVLLTLLAPDEGSPTRAIGLARCSQGILRTERNFAAPSVGELPLNAAPAPGSV